MTDTMLRKTAARLGFTITKRIPANERRTASLRGEGHSHYLIPERHQTFETAADVYDYLRKVEIVRNG